MARETNGSRVLAEMSVENILAIYNRATLQDRKSGMTWYSTGNAIARDIADGDAAKGAGVLAAFSPQCAWGRNVAIAAQAFTTGVASGHMGAQCAKAQAIMGGKHYSKVLNKGKRFGKEFCFAQCLENPTDPFALCVDRHMIDIAAGKFCTTSEAQGVFGSAAVYACVQELYREAAAQVGILPQQLQAICWVCWRREKGLTDDGGGKRIQVNGKKGATK